jgi:hypothetical protein
MWFLIGTPNNGVIERAEWFQSAQHGQIPFVRTALEVAGHASSSGLGDCAGWAEKNGEYLRSKIFKNAVLNGTKVSSHHAS